MKKESQQSFLHQKEGQVVPPIGTSGGYHALIALSHTHCIDEPTSNGASQISVLAST